MFRYDADTDHDVFPQYINQVHLYVYSMETGELVYNQICSQASLGYLQGTRLSLPMGEYRAVCWGNSYELSTLSGCTLHCEQEEGHLIHPACLTGGKIETNDPLYYGTYDFTIRNGENQVETVPFHCAHIDFEVYVKGYESQGHYVGGEQVTTRIHFNNLLPEYDFWMEKHGTMVSYFPSSAHDTSKECTASYTRTLRFNEQNPITIDVLDAFTGKTVYTLSLQDFIENEHIRITGKEEITIVILIEFHGMDVTVQVPNWEEVPVLPEI